MLTLNSKQVNKQQVATKLLSYILVFVGAFGVSAFVNGDLNIVIQLSVAIVFLFFLKWYLTEDTYPIVVVIFTWYVTVLVTFIAWENGGIWDTSLFAYTGILIVASLYGGRLLHLPILGFMIISIYSIQYATITGLISPSIITEGLNWNKANNISIFLLIYSFSMDYLTKSINSSHKRTETANKNLTKVIEEKELETLKFRQSSLLNDLAAQKKFDELSSRKGCIPAVVAIKLLNYDKAVFSYGNEEAIHLLTSLSNTLSSNPSFHIFQNSENVILLVIEIDEHEQLESYIRDLTQLLYMPISTSSSEFSYVFQGGVTQCPFDGKEFSTLLNRAMITIDYNSYTQEIIHFTPNMEENVLNLINTTRDLKRATANKEFELFYQPKVSIKTNEVVGVEALIRWNNNGKFISPELFISLAEKNGYIANIGKWVLEQACKDCTKWNAMKEKSIPVAVNISQAQFISGQLPKQITKILADTRIPPEHLELEITESMEIDNSEHILHQIDLLRELGVKISIDDFGTGYSNLSNIAFYKASTLKIDKSFITNLTNNEQNLQLIQSILNIANVYNMSVVAEGIEDIETANILSDLGCDIGQGYFWSKPLPYDSLISYMN